jgi:hypothetical protein
VNKDIEENHLDRVFPDKLNPPNVKIQSTPPPPHCEFSIHKFGPIEPDLSRNAELD